MTDRRSFVSRALAFLGIGSVATLVVTEVDAKANTMTLHPAGREETDAERAERLEVSLAGVSTAASGWNQDVAKPGDWAWHPAYQDTLDLRRKFDAALRMLRERIPPGQQIALYPCGCSALGNLPDGEMLPLNCGSEDHSAGCATIVFGERKPRPTIEELEAILAQDGNGAAVMALPDGQVTVWPA